MNELKEAKKDLYRMLLAIPLDEITEAEVDIMMALYKDEEISNLFKSPLWKRTQLKQKLPKLVPNDDFHKDRR